MDTLTSIVKQYIVGSLWQQDYATSNEGNSIVRPKHHLSRQTSHEHSGRDLGGVV